jgi:hypothetical protein
MGQDARQQPGAWHDDQAQLPKKHEGVQLEPVLSDPSFDEAVELKAGERDLVLGRRKPLKLPGVGALEVDTLCDQFAFSNRLLHGDAEIRKPLDESRKEPSPRLGVQRFGLQTRGSISNVIRRTNISLGRVVAFRADLGLEPVDENPGAVTYQVGPSFLLVYPSDYAGTNQATGARWAVGDEFEAAVEDLRKKGVVFEQYDLSDTTHEGDIHVMGEMRAAWFKDPDGNILSLVNQAM